MKLGTVLIIMTVIASAMAVLFVLHAETDSSSAEVIEGGQCGPDARYYIYSDGTLEINGVGAMYDYGGFTHSPWYDHRDEITKIVIGDGITQLGVSAFIGLKHVTELTIPISLDSVVSDVSPVFTGCFNIEKIIFTLGKDGCGYNYAAYSGFDSWYQNTPWYQSRDSLKEITFAYGTEYIGSDSFRELNITSIVLPDTVCSLGNHCFYNCTKLTDLTLPISLNSFGNEKYPAFEGCLAVKNMTFTRGNGVPFDYSGGSTGNVNLAPWNLEPSVLKTVTIADDITSLGKYMFFGCNLTELTLPISVVQNNSHCAFQTPYQYLLKVTITKGAGSGCDYAPSFSFKYNPWNSAVNLQTIVLEEGVTHIGESMFSGCSTYCMVLPNSLISLSRASFDCCNIKELTIPISLNSVWLEIEYAFFEVHGLEKITFAPGSGYGFDYAAYYGSNSWYQYTPWYICRDTLKEIVFEEGIKSIGSDAFRELNITSLVIPDSVESLGNHTFYNCRGLTDLTVPITLNCDGPKAYPAFEGCNNITKLRFTAGTDGVGFDYENCAPFWCTPTHKAVQITIDSGVRYIGDQTFAGYTFVGSHGMVLKHTAECLSGHTFTKTDGCSYVIDDISDGNFEIPAYYGCTGLNLMTGVCRLGIRC